MNSPVYTYKKLHHLYTVHDTYTAGIILEGWEAKSLQDYAGNIETAYCAMKGVNFCLVNSKITPAANHLLDGSVTEKESRDRILLLNKIELTRIKEKLATKGWTCVPAKLYRNGKHLWKLELALVTGKNLFDRRQDIKKKDIEREMKRDIH